MQTHLIVFRLLICVAIWANAALILKENDFTKFQLTMHGAITIALLFAMILL